MPISIRTARILAGKTQKDMAEIIGVCRQTYIKIESNPELCTIGQAKVISQTTNTPIDDIFFGATST